MLEHRRVVSWDNHTEETTMFMVPLDVKDNMALSDIIRQVMDHLDITPNNYEMIQASQLPDHSFVFILRGVEDMNDEISVWIVGNQNRR